jgi:aspartyl protease family protein
MHNLGQDGWAQLMYGILLLSFLIGGYFFRGNIEKSKAIKQIGIWLAIIFVVTVTYGLKDKWMQAFLPHQPIVKENSIEIQRSSDNHFYIIMELNNKEILFLIDTGATDTTLTLSDAKKVGIDTDNLIYNKKYSTAKGTVYGATVKLAKVQIENLVFNDVWVSVNREGLSTSLLGMNFLKRFDGYDIRGDTLILYY